MTATAETISNELIQDFTKAETIFAALIDEGRTPTYIERTFLKRLDIDTELKIAMQRERVARMRRFRAASGTAADRDKQANEVVAAKDIFDKQGPKLKAQIEKLEAQYRSLENDHTNAQTRLEQMNAAVQNLRECVPDFVKKQVEADRFYIGSTIGMEMNALKTERDHLKLLIESQASFVEDGIEARPVDDVETLKKRLAEIEPELKQRTAEYERLCAECVKPLDYYIV